MAEAYRRYMEQGYKALNQRYLLTAISFFKKALHEFPESDEAYASIGTCYVLGRKWKEALGYFIEALRINPKNASALENISIVYDNIGNKDMAAEYAARAASHAKREKTTARAEASRNIEIIARRKKGATEDDRILSCPYCSSLFFRDNIYAWLDEYGKCPTCGALLTKSKLVRKDWNAYKNERCAIDMIRFDMKR